MGTIYRRQSTTYFDDMSPALSVHHRVEGS